MGFRPRLHMDRFTVSTPVNSLRAVLTSPIMQHSHTHYKPHSHRGLTTHLIVSGDLTISYPKDGSRKETHGVGARLDVPANRVHEVWIGDEGCTMVIGE